MDRISIRGLDYWRTSGQDFTLLDVRRAKVRLQDGVDIPGSRWLAPEELFAWKDEIARDRPAIVVCAQGHELSQGVAATLRALGLDARFLIDGFSGWRDAGLATQPIAGGGR